jgi:hypothetical protein
MTQLQRLVVEYLTKDKEVQQARVSSLVKGA